MLHLRSLATMTFKEAQAVVGGWPLLHHHRMLGHHSLQQGAHHKVGGAGIAAIASCQLSQARHLLCKIPSHKMNT